jgi:gas vesicle protein
MPAAEVEQAVSIWTWAGPLAGVVVGGLLGGTSQMLVEWRRGKHQRREDLMEVRRTAYFEALDVAEAMREAFDDLRIAMAGRIDEEDASTPEEAEEMRQRDQAGVAAFNQVFANMRAVHRVAIKVSAVGSPRVRAAISQVNAAVDEYMDELGRQMNSDGIFRGAAAAAFAENYERVSDDLSAAIRADLDIDRIVNERR